MKRQSWNTVLLLYQVHVHIDKRKRIESFPGALQSLADRAEDILLWSKVCLFLIQELAWSRASCPLRAFSRSDLA